ncbi:MAG: Rrf2 family transcriptional regulator [Acidobacteria bacterium]|nr:Rrf2 family transcriptional regulator [Acidobacteriota bacterium]
MLTATSEHALRALVELATLPAGGPLLGWELARRADVPANYLSKILWALGNAGIVDASRGIKGGYRLRRKPEDIHLIDVVDVIDGRTSNTRCLLSGARGCSEANPCVAHESCREARTAVRSFLANTTIKHLVERRLTVGSHDKSGRHAGADI